ncbi:MAG: hypothetical protein RIB61_07690 [Roseicyclus sp.]
MKNQRVQKPQIRISAKLREAMRLHVREGLTITAACEAADMSRQGWHKAMKRAAVRVELETEKGRFVAEVESRRSIFNAPALEVAADFMRNAKSESVRARMVEFLAGYGQPQKQTTSRPVTPQPVTPGYSYPTPPAHSADEDDGGLIRFA